MHADVVVLGAGPAGLGAAYRAARAGHRVVVLERADAPGGAARSLSVDGIRVDLGSHRLHPSVEPRILAVLQGLLGGDLQRRERNGRIRLAGRWIGFPLRPADLLLHLPPSFAAAAAWDTLSAPARRARADTFAEVLRAGLGPTMCERFYFPYARKLWGLPPEELAGEQARRRVAADSPVKLLARVLRGSGREPPSFFYPRRGFGQLWERLADAAACAGADLRYEQEVAAVDADAGTVTTTQGVTVSAEQIWSTLPLTALARMAGGPADTLVYRAMLLVYLVLDGRPYTPYDAHYLPEPSTPVTRISEPTNYRDSADDPRERTVLCAEIPCAPGDSLWSADAGTLGEVAVAALRASDLPPARPRAVHVHRLAHAYPVYTTGAAAAFAAVDGWAAAQPRLLTFGRQGLFAHDNSHHALAMAWAAADALEGDGGFDARAWAAARARFADHVVED